jgi:hypothetical protein
MALQLRRGLDAARTAITPAEGEILYATDTKKVWVGDGTTAGGIAVGSSTLATSGVSAGTYGDSTTVPVFAVDTYGRVTSVSNTGIAFPSAGFTSITAGGSSFTASSVSGAFSLVAGTNVNITRSGGAITIESTASSSSGPTWTANTTMGGTMTVTSPTGYGTSGSKLVVVVVGTMSGTTTNFSLSSGTSTWTSPSPTGSNTFVYVTSTGSTVGSTITITPSAYSNYAMAYAYITSGTNVNSSSTSSTSTSTTISGPSGNSGQSGHRIIAVSSSQYLNLSTAASTASWGPTWATGVGYIHPSTTSLSAAVWVGTGSWGMTSTTVNLSSNPGYTSWYLTGLAA